MMVVLQHYGSIVILLKSKKRVRVSVFAEDIEAFEVNTLGDYKKYFPDGFQGRIDELY